MDLASGYQDREDDIKLTVDNIFPAGSTTKCITAVGILKLYEQGRIGLNDSISMHVDKILQASNGTTLLELWGGN